MVAVNRMRGLTARLILAFVAFTVVSAAAAGLPGIWLVRSALDRQARAQAADVARVTDVLLRAEQDRLADLAQLVGQRPTLVDLLQHGSPDDLATYLGTLRSGADLDLIVALGADGARTVAGAEAPADLPVTGSAAVAWDDATGTAVILAAAPIADGAVSDPAGTVVVGRRLDGTFLQQLAAQTGAELSVLRGGERVASSLDALPAAAEAMAAEDAEPVRVTLAGSPYYAGVMPLPAGDESSPFSVEVALPIAGLIAAQRRALGLLVATTAGVALAGGLLGVVLARSLTRPLERLTGAANAISRGDLTTPVPVPDEPEEVVLLATALEQSRASIQQTLEELSRASLWAETLIQSIVEGVVTFDTGGRITFFSNGAERILGLSQAEVLGKSLETAFSLPDDDRAAGERFIDQIPPRGQRQKVEVVTADGRALTLALTGERLAPPGSDELQVALVFRDVTVEEAARGLRGHILANITHEFRTPLSALNASLELLTDHPQVAQAGVDELLDSMRLGVLNLHTLIDNLLESSSIEAGRFGVRPRPTDLNVVLAEVVQVIRPLLQARDQTLALTEPPDLPQVQADPARLSQVFINLLSNASKYAPPSSTIDLAFEMGDNGVRVAVADRGPGIPEGERRLLFRRFVRAGQPDNHSQYGIGLGLAVAKSIVEGQGGAIGVEERPGGGAVFWFTVPQSPAASETPQSGEDGGR